MHIYIEEIFSSIQGEGPWVGLPQIFIRFSGCNLKCTYCDTPARLAKRPLAHFETTPLSHQLESVSNPVDLNWVLEKVSHLNQQLPVESVVLTGGEPLLFVPFLKQLLPKLKAMKLKIYLETNGMFSEALLQLKPLIDYVSMDFKLEKYLQGDHTAKQHFEFLETLLTHFQDQFYVKIVFNDQNKQDVEEVIKIQTQLLAHGLAPQQMVWQPIWEKDPQVIALPKSLQGRLIPQTHKVLAVL